MKERGRLDVSERERLVRSWSTKTRDPVHGGTTLRFILNTHLKLHPLSYAQASGMGQHSASQGQRRLQPVPTLSRSGLQLPSGQMEMAMFPPTAQVSGQGVVIARGGGRVGGGGGSETASF